MLIEYSPAIAKNMQLLYNSLSEKDRRRYAAVEAEKLGHGGIAYIADLFGCNEKTIRKGMQELQDKDSMQQPRIRRSGGGRKTQEAKYENIDQVFLDVIREHTAGNPMDEKVKWTHLKRGEIRDEMKKKGIHVSSNIIKRLLKKHGYVKRKALKKQSTGQHKDRDAQFQNIERLRTKYQKDNNPIISVDAKKKESIGNLYREGYLETTESVEVYDHDFPSLAESKVTPYAVYDLKHNESFINLSTSADTSDFACDSIKLWWETIGKNQYPNATSILILADGGGSNSSRSHRFKESLQNLSNQLGIELRMAHYPPYASKWNPIEHRVFPHVTRALSGVILVSLSLLKTLIKRTKTSSGLKVFVNVSKTIYETGKKVAKDFYDYANIKFDELLGRWNYTVNPVF